ncbi:FKBP-type peptidyl-prolyl cis-trans isomerase [Cesiribacter sp. SM1]|uniref:FKBP-type peptidyl-prolyl cis-trans isomerase n=1 Tax=Cesiribacter sp. SM1 TaxID=2861196 RepID=UPI001CD3061E|nr:FKBP-type peptidyl-prolyl cis-trans isomerase [Cesiribacter sp. SM1]
MYKSFLKAGLLLAVAGLATACGGNKEREVSDDLKTRESGLQYKFFRVGEEANPDSTKFLVMNIRATTGKDSVFFDTQERGMDEIMPVNNPQFKGMLAEGIKMLHQGDSALIVVPANNFFIQTMGAPVPAGIDENSKMNFYIGVKDVVDEQVAQQIQMESIQKMQAKAAGRQKEQLLKDVQTIDKYLAEHSIVADTTASGVRIQVTERGSGDKPQRGDNLVVHYRGKVLEGEQFDASYDRNEPFTFAVGQGMVIPGWDESLLELPKGSKATIFIPSPLAYGEQQRSEVIKPNSILVFEVEVLDVQKKQ